jgi:hypothetical protein
MQTLPQESSIVSASLQAILEYQIKLVAKILGAKPLVLAEDVMAPTVWAIIAKVTNKLSLFQAGRTPRKSVEAIIKESKRKLMQYIDVLLNQQKKSVS